MEVDSDHEAGASGGAGTSGAVSKDRKRFEVKTIHLDSEHLLISFASGEEVECCCTVGLGHCGGQLCHLQVIFPCSDFCEKIFINHIMYLTSGYIFT